VTAARDVVLARIRKALGEPAPVTVARSYRQVGVLTRDQVIARFVERVEECGARVAATSEAVSAVEQALDTAGAARVVIAPDFPPDLRPAGVELVEDSGLSADELDALDGALTTCAVACAETGTIALDTGPGQGRRAITLVPDLHVCVVDASQIVETVPELFERLAPSARAGRPIVLVSGPSATSDIELNRVEGVHGPRRLAVVVVNCESSGHGV
jgi:L-lactate dehydrogenase complex protein LldG